MWHESFRPYVPHATPNRTVQNDVEAEKALSFIREMSRRIKFGAEPGKKRPVLRLRDARR